jgi:hypothetical protein
MGLARLSPGEEGFEDFRVRHLPSDRESSVSRRPVENRRRGLVGQRAKAAALASHKSKFNLGTGRFAAVTNKLPEKDETGRVCLPNEAWAQGPEFANASISRLVV